MATNEEVKVKLSAEFESKGVKQGAAQVQSALDQTEKAFEQTEIASKNLQKSLENTSKSTEDFSKSVSKIKPPAGIKGLSKSIGKAGLAGALTVGTVAATSLVAGVGAAAAGIIQLGRASKGSYESLRAYEGGLSSIKQATSGTTEEMSKLDGIIRDLGARTGEDIGNVANYVAQFASLGVGQKEATEAVTAALNVAKSTGQDTSRVVTALMGAYKGSASEAEKLGINVQGLTKEQLIAGEAVERIQEAYGKTLATSAQISKIEAETNKHLQEAEEIKANMWTQAEGLRETWDLIKLAISKIKVIALKAFQPMVKHINRAVKYALDLRGTLKLSGYLLEEVFLGVLAKITQGYADIYRFMTSWSATALNFIGINIDFIGEKLDALTERLNSRIDEARAKREALSDAILDQFGDAGDPASGGAADDTSGLSDRDTRIFPTKEPKAKKEPKEKKEREKKKKVGEVAKGEIDPLKGSLSIQDLIDYEERVRSTTAIFEVLDANLQDLTKTVELSVSEVKEVVSVGQFVKDGIQKNVLKPIEALKERLKDFDGVADFVKHEFKIAAMETTKNFLASAGKFAKELPDKLLGNVKDAFKALPGMVASAAIQGAENVTAASDIEDMRDGSLEGELAATEATIANAEAGVESAENITGSILDMIVPGLGGVFEALLSDPEQINTFFESLTNGFTIMVQKLAENIGPIIKSFAKNVPKIITAVVVAIPDIIEALVEELPGAIEILISEVIKNLPRIVSSMVRMIGITFKALVVDIPRILWAMIRAFLGFGSYDDVDLDSGAPKNKDELEAEKDKAKRIQAQIDARKAAEKDGATESRTTRKGTTEIPRIAPISIKGEVHTDKVLTSAEAFNPYINQDFKKEVKQPVKIEIQIGDQRLREIITDLQETGYPTVVTA